AAWRVRAAALPVADLSWRVTRDGAFGGPKVATASRRLRLSGDRFRLDGVERLAETDDGRLLLQPDGDLLSEAEFRQALSSGFAGPTTSEVIRPRSWVFGSGDSGPPGGSSIDRLLASAALLAVRPLSAIGTAVDHQKLAVTPRRASCRGRACIVLEEAVPGGRRTLWVEPAEHFRIVRALGWADRFSPSQFDY